MKSPLIKLSFNGGELSPYLDGRVDYPKYSTGCKQMTNFVPTVYGPMTKRPGTRFVESIASVGGGSPSLIPFEFSESQSYILALVDQSMLFYTNDGRLLNGGVPYSLATPYDIADTNQIQVAQNGDIMYFTHPNYPVYKLSRLAVDEFTFEEVEFANGPFDDENTDKSITIAVTALDNTPGETVLLQANQAIFEGDSIGRLVGFSYIPSTLYDTWEPESHEFDGTDIKYDVDDKLTYLGNVYQVTGSESGVTLPSRTGRRSPLHEEGTESDGKLLLTYIGSEFGYVKITSKTTDSEVNGEIIKTIPDNLVGDPPIFPVPTTSAWSLGSFNNVSGYPNALTFHEQRLVFGGTRLNPQTIYGSTIGAYEDFEKGVDDDNSYQFTIAANKKNPVEWLVSNVTLNVGTLGGEFFASSSGPSITPSDIVIQQIGQYGSSEEGEPLIANGFTVFIQAGGRKLRELRFDEDSQRNFARDLNKVAEHLADTGIAKISYQAEPYQIIWVIIGDELYALTYETDEDVFAWSRQSVGPVSSIATVPNAGNDRLWMVIERSGNYYIEYLTRFYRRGDELQDSCFVDSSLEYEGPETTTITGLDHLEGETVSILNNGSVAPSKVVAGGSIELQFPTTKAIIGLPMKSEWQSMRLEGGSNDGLGQGKAKRLSRAIFRLDETGAGLTYGKGNLDLEFEQGYSAFLPVRNTNDNMDSPPSLRNGDDWRVPVSGGSDTQYMFRVEHNDPVPCTITAIILTVDTSQ